MKVNDHRSYIYLRPSPFLPTVLLTADEALALTMAKQTFAAWAGTPLENLLDTAFHKFARASAGNITFSSQSVITTPATMINASEQRRMAVVFTALFQIRELSVSYQKPNSQTIEERVFWPLHLNWPDHSWIVLVHDVGDNLLGRHGGSGRARGGADDGAGDRTPVICSIVHRPRSGSWRPSDRACEGGTPLRPAPRQPLPIPAR